MFSRVCFTQGTGSGTGGSALEERDHKYRPANLLSLYGNIPIPDICAGACGALFTLLGLGCLLERFHRVMTSDSLC